MNEQRVEQQRITVYVPKEKYLQLRSKLILMGKSVSSWFREHLEDYLVEGHQE